MFQCGKVLNPKPAVCMRPMTCAQSFVRNQYTLDTKGQDLRLMTKLRSDDALGKVGFQVPNAKESSSTPHCSIFYGNVNI